ncbi:MAG: PilZ domain-containing protein [Desulfobacterales bacterium]
MDNLRKFERFALTIPVRAEMYLSDKRQVFDLRTRDISASGAFIYTPEPFSNGTHLKLNLTLTNAKIKKITGAESVMDCEGTVVRSTPAGVGVHFNKGCRVSSLIGL